MDVQEIHFTKLIEFINKIKSPSLFIYSDSSLKKCGLEISNSYITIIDNKQSISTYETLISHSYFINIISFGGGKTIDICKLLSSKYSLSHYCIPTMLSTNSFSTDKVPSFNIERITMQSELPGHVIIDKELLSLSYHQNLWGIADIFSIHTALFDWNLAEKAKIENIDYLTYEKASCLLSRTIAYVLDNDEYDLLVLYSLIAESGLLTFEYRSGRPESGSEHIFAKNLESKVMLPHGIAVCIGVLLMSILQDNFSVDIVQCFYKLQYFDDISKYCTNNDIIDVLKTLKKREDRYSVIDEKDIDISSLIESFNKMSKNLETHLQTTG